MKAVIVELRKKKAAALLEDGAVVVVANKNYAIGQQIRYTAAAHTTENTMRAARKISAWAAGIAAVLCIGAGAYAFQSPYSYVSVDVNPSIQFTLNRYDQVLKVTAVNSDAQPIVDMLSGRQIAYRNIEQAVELTIDSLASTSYFDDGGYVLIAAASKNEDKAEELTSTLTRTALKMGPETLTVEAVTGEPAQVKQANEEGISLGRKKLLQELQKNADPSKPFSYDEWRSKSVEELIRSFEQSEGRRSDEQQPSFSGNGSTVAEQQAADATGQNLPLIQPDPTCTPSPELNGGSSNVQKPEQSAEQAPKTTRSPAPAATTSPPAEGPPEGSQGSNEKPTSAGSQR